MKAIRLYTIMLAICALFVTPFAAYAQVQNGERERIIIERCQSFTSLIDQLQRRDLVSRTNLGREYETVSKQFNAFNQRLRNNDIDSKPFEQISTQFTDATNSFRAAYVRYDDSINKLLTIDCKTNPAAFDAQLMVSRELRQATLTAANRARDLIGEYRTLVQPLANPPATQQPANGVAP